MTYFDNAGRPDVLSGGVRIVPVSTPAGAHRVWTKRTGNHASTKLLLLHGGPGATHEYLLAFDSFLPASGVEYYYYDQLGSGWSDRPDDPELWMIDRFVDEVEQVRRALGLDSENFILYGQSWGGLLAIEYALAHQQELKGLIISNMMASIPAYSRACRTAPRGRLFVFKGRLAVAAPARRLWPCMEAVAQTGPRTGASIGRGQQSSVRTLRRGVWDNAIPGAGFGASRSTVASATSS